MALVFTNRNKQRLPAMAFLQVIVKGRALRELIGPVVHFDFRKNSPFHFQREGGRGDGF